MTTTSTTQPLTALTLLFGEAEHHSDALADALKRHGVLGPLGTRAVRASPAGQAAAGTEVGAAASQLLDLDLGSQVVAGWGRHAALTAALDRTLANPDSAEVVELASHRISSTCQPSIELLVNDVHVATIKFELRLEFLVRALVVTVRQGHLVSLRSGTCDVAGSLAAEGVQLVARQRHIELPLLIHLPLRIHPGDPLSTAANPAEL
ncbi:MAG TPA: hypothetical protein VFD04_16535 [Actinomycetes bacterium]|jgi:hypothetical protein|nr:hypothetical protein [Actinomycetes bacterium]